MTDNDIILTLVILFELYVAWYIVMFTLINWLGRQASLATTRRDLANLLLWARLVKIVSGADQLHRRRASDLEAQLVDQLSKFSDLPKAHE